MAKVESFRIKNYKSILDSKKCYVDNEITVLAGKNEAGKTAILQALDDFNFSKNIREEAIMISNKGLKPEIEVTLLLEDKDLNEIFVDSKQRQSVKENKVTITKIYPNKYSISEESVNRFVPNKSNLIKNIKKEFDFLDSRIENIDSIGIEIDKLGELNYLPTFGNFIPKFKEDVKEKEHGKINKVISKIREDAKEFNSIKQLESKFLETIESKIIPNFILFSSFDDILPDQIAISEAPNNSLIKDLSLISNLDFDKIKSSSPPDEREKHKDEVNLKFSEKYKQFWTQDSSELYFWWDSNYIYFRIKEDEEYYKIAIRSKGRQWHMAFYIRVTARSAENRNNVILIDEPGLFLHAKAQKDILSELESCAFNNQIIYATHSPYLIQPNKLCRVRLVEKYSHQGTKIEKVNAKADKETLTPILTAIGEDLSAGIRVDKKNSIILEGYSDYIYLNAFKSILGISTDLNFVPAMGGDTPTYIGSILFGWGLDPIFILDNDSQGKTVKEKLKKKLNIDDKRILLIPKGKQGAIENLFSAEDYKRYVENKSNIGKVLLALHFSQKVMNKEIKSSDLSADTINNFKQLFTDLVDLVEKV